MRPSTRTSTAATPLSASAQPKRGAVPSKALPPPTLPPKEPKGWAAFAGETGASATPATTIAASTMLRFIATHLRLPPPRPPRPERRQAQEGSRHVRPNLKYYVNFSRDCKGRRGGKSIIDEHQSLTAASP